MYLAEKKGLQFYVREEKDAMNYAKDGYTITKLQEMRLDEEGRLTEVQDEPGGVSGTGTGEESPSPVIVGKGGKA